jgi:hypothetical protein
MPRGTNTIFAHFRTLPSLCYIWSRELAFAWTRFRSCLPIGLKSLLYVAFAIRLNIPGYGRVIAFDWIAEWSFLQNASRWKLERAASVALAIKQAHSRFTIPAKNLIIRHLLSNLTPCEHTIDELHATIPGLSQYGNNSYAILFALPFDRDAQLSRTNIGGMRLLFDLPFAKHIFW